MEREEFEKVKAEVEEAAKLWAASETSMELMIFNATQENCPPEWFEELMKVRDVAWNLKREAINEYCKHGQKHQGN